MTIEIKDSDNKGMKTCPSIFCKAQKKHFVLLYVLLPLLSLSVLINEISTEKQKKTLQFYLGDFESITNDPTQRFQTIKIPPSSNIQPKSNLLCKYHSSSKI
jgi:hypothetical protein